MTTVIKRPWVEQRQFGPLGSGALVQIGAWTLGQLREKGVVLKPRDRLERAVILVGEVHQQIVRVTPDDPLTAERAAEAIRTVWEFHLIARCLARATPETLRKVQRALKGSDLPRTDKRTEPRDLQFELFVAATFALGGVLVRGAEPDLRIIRDEQERGVAVKRVSNARRLEERLPEGAAQLRTNGVPGYVVVNLDAFLHGLTESSSAEEAGRRFDDRVGALHSMLPELAGEPALLGVLGVGTVVDWSFRGELPAFGLLTFLQFRDFVEDDPVERAKSDAFFDAFRTRVEERLASAYGTP